MNIILAVCKEHYRIISKWEFESVFAADRADNNNQVIYPATTLVIRQQAESLPDNSFLMGDLNESLSEIDTSMRDSNYSIDNESIKSQSTINRPVSPQFGSGDANKQVHDFNLI